ncbi:Variable surface protein Vir7-like protein [Plasmodium coatneyi]|uniref:Variable surface protein Vir7-like protein n=1 Tax=Plasmodium coatneyi TaxID=208452 RepID=A0A1B1DWC3_9APIC|nr:Variable surface protein Vir7-like protein [Plasmodium coatneyi]ANQ07096.1 Variable surface protein Vir7-like protein [Plasmodium coatneyi]
MPENEKCDFLYYWMGDYLWTETSVKSLSDAMKTIYNAFETWDVTENCNNKYNNDIDKTLFQNRKLVFDYYHDYKKLQSLLPNIDSRCNVECTGYIQNITEACNKVKSDCQQKQTSHQSDHFCTWFKNENEKNAGGNDYCAQDKLSQLKCGAATEPGVVASERGPGAPSPTSSGSNNTTTVATALSSIFATIGLPTVAFFLYKVIMEGIKI